MFVDVLSLAREDTHLRNKARLELEGPCPDTSCRCQTNGFSVKWNAKTEKWVFMCRGCWDSADYITDKNGATRKRGWGDTISYLRHYRHMTYTQARSFLDGENCDSPPPAAPQVAFVEPETVYQRLKRDMKRYEAKMLDSAALEYASSRGLTNETIRWARLGYSDDDGIPRLVIPSLNDHQCVALMRRDLRPDVPHDERWKDVSGSSKELYLADSLERKLPTILCEDAFSALSVLQEMGKDNINAVATCGADCCQDVRWLARLARMPLVLVAFDADKAGDENAVWWLTRLPNARRLRPILSNATQKDINDMLIDGWDIREWIERELTEQESDDQALVCAQCNTVQDDTNALDFYYGEDGAVYCSQACEDAASAPTPTLDRELSNEEIAKRLVAKVPGRTQIMPTSEVYHFHSWELEEQERDRKMWALVRAKFARPKSLEWTLAQRRERDLDAEQAAYEDAAEGQETDAAWLLAGDRLARLSELYRDDTPRSVFWRLQFNGWTPENISASECVRRLRILLSSDDAKARHEANNDIESRLYMGQRRWA